MVNAKLGQLVAHRESRLARTDHHHLRISQPLQPGNLAGRLVRR